MQRIVSEGSERGQPDVFGQLPFVTTAAHELKAPLSLVRQLALALEHGNVSPEEQLRMVRQISLTSERALRLTTDLTRASRLEDSLFECEPINPRQLCEEVAHELSPLYQAKDREIRVVGAYRQLLVVANRELLRRILLNFGDNALHYADPAQPVELQVTARPKDQQVRIGVRDFGPAVPAGLWQQLQQQLGATPLPLHARPQSSGLGLYVAQQFATAMNGAIGATRHRDGATFYVDMEASTQLSLL